MIIQHFAQRQFALFFLSLLFLTFTVREGLSQPDDFRDEQGVGPSINLGKEVNTEWAEIMPVVSPDGKRLYFSRKEAPENMGGKEDLEDIYYSELQADGSWGKAVNAGSPLNSTGSDLLFSFSEDGSAALVYHGKVVNGKEVGLAITRLKNKVWSEPQSIKIEGLNSLGDYYYAHMSRDGKHLFISYSASNNPTNLDIYSCEALSNDMLHWSKPVPMDGINTPFIEGSPFLSPDGRTLYLISDRVGGNGLADVYVAQRTGDNWDVWTFPEILNGYPSTPLFEASVSVAPDGKNLYISRTAIDPNASGRLDIYRCSLPEALGLKNSFVLRGKLVDKATGKGIAGRIYASPQRETKIVAEAASGKDGTFSMILVAGFLLTIRGEASGYELGGITFDGRRLNLPTEVSPRTIELVKKGSTTTAITKTEEPTIFFSSGSAVIPRSGEQKLRQFAKWAKDEKQMIEILGYTDSVGTDENNQQLAMQRAEAVKAFLTRAGIAVSRMVTKSFGEKNPAADNGTTRGREANRRVEIQFSEDEDLNSEKVRMSPTQRINTSKR